MKFLEDHRWAGISGIVAILALLAAIIIPIATAQHSEPEPSSGAE